LKGDWVSFIELHKADKIMAIKAIRVLLGCDLKKAKQNFDICKQYNDPSAQ